MNRVTTALIALLVALPSLGGCSDKLPPPTAGGPLPTESIAFSWMASGPFGLEGPMHLAVVNETGRNRRDSLAQGTVLAMSDNGRMVISRTDDFGMVSLWYGSIDAPTNVIQFASESGNDRIDRGSVAISSDGQKIAYYSNDYSGALLLYIADLGSPTLPLQSIPLQAAPVGFAMPAPSFSPDGDSIAYVDYDSQKGGYQLIAMDLTSYYPIVLAWNVVPIGWAAIDWSPRGGAIIYAGVDISGAQETGVYAVDVSDLTSFDPTDPTYIDTIAQATNGDLLLEPIWSADGASVAYVAFNQLGGSTARAVTVATKATRTIASSPRVIEALRWSRDGSKLVYTESDQTMLTPDFTMELLTGTLTVAEVATGTSRPLATRAVRGFWVE